MALVLPLRVRALLLEKRNRCAQAALPRSLYNWLQMHPTVRRGAAAGVALGLFTALRRSVGSKESLRGNLWRSLDELGGYLVPVQSPFLGWPRV